MKTKKKLTQNKIYFQIPYDNDDGKYIYGSRYSKEKKVKFHELKIKKEN